MYLFKKILPNSSWVLKLSVGITAALALSSCATMSEGECLTADWYEQGFRDGRQGYPPSRVIDHRDACAVVDVTPDLDAYRMGRDGGIAEYCAPSNAVAEGRAGNPYGHVCPIGLEDSFLFYYRQGQRAYEAQQHVDNLNRQSRTLQSELDKEEDAEAQKRLRNQLRDLDDSLQRARDELAEYDRSLPYR